MRFPLLVSLCLLSKLAIADPILYYNLVPHASGSDCALAKQNLTSSELYSGTSAEGVPTVTDHALTYTVASLAEATQLCAQVDGVPASLLPAEEASEYQASAHPWYNAGSTTVDPDDNSCALAPEGGTRYSYLQLAGHCNANE